MQDFIGLTSETMPDGSMMILSPDTGDEFLLTQEQVDAFNQAYADGLANSTAQALTVVKLNDMIDIEQQVYEEQKQELEDAATEISTVTAVAEMLVTGDQETKIAAESYATENNLTAIDQGSVDQFNNSVTEMVEASATKNMIEVYAQDVFVVDTIANAFMATETIMDFFDNSIVSIDAMNHTKLNLEWSQVSVGVESIMYDMYAAVPFYDEGYEIVPMPRPQPVLGE